MSALVRRVVSGWSVAMDGDEPTVLDEELGARLGFARPRKIRDLIERLIRAGRLNILSRPTVGRQLTNHGGSRKFVVNEYWLNEAQALKVIAKSDTATADAILDEVIAVFIAVRRARRPLRDCRAVSRGWHPARARLRAAAVPGTGHLPAAGRAVPGGA